MQLPLLRLIILFALLIVLGAGAYAIVKVRKGEPLPEPSKPVEDVTKEKEVVKEQESESRREPPQPTEDVVYVESDSSWPAARRKVYRIDPVNAELLSEIETVMSTAPIPDGKSLVYVLYRENEGDEIRNLDFDSDQENVLYTAPPNSHIYNLEYRKGSKYLLFTEEKEESENILLFALDRANGGAPLPLETNDADSIFLRSVQGTSSLYVWESNCEGSDADDCDGIAQPPSLGYWYLFNSSTAELQPIEPEEWPASDAPEWKVYTGPRMEDKKSIVRHAEKSFEVDYKSYGLLVSPQGGYVVPLAYEDPRLEVYQTDTFTKIFELTVGESRDYNAVFLSEATLAIQNTDPNCRTESCQDILIVDVRDKKERRISHSTRGGFIDNH